MNGSPVAVLFTSDTFSEASNSNAPPNLLRCSSAFWSVLRWGSAPYKLAIGSSCSESCDKWNPSVSGLSEAWAPLSREARSHHSSAWALRAERKRADPNQEWALGIPPWPPLPAERRAKGLRAALWALTCRERIGQMQTEIRSWLAAGLVQFLRGGCCLVFNPDPLTSPPLLWIFWLSRFSSEDELKRRRSVLFKSAKGGNTAYLFVFSPSMPASILYSFASRDEQNASPEAVVQTAFKATFQPDD